MEDITAVAKHYGSHFKEWIKTFSTDLLDQVIAGVILIDYEIDQIVEVLDEGWQEQFIEYLHSKGIELYDVLSPDGFSIHHSAIYLSEAEAESKFKEWKKQYERQGYYSSVRAGRIPLKELREYSQVVTMMEKFERQQEIFNQ